MPSIHLPYINIALDAFAFLVLLIIILACISEFSSKKRGLNNFLVLQCSVAVALLADIIAWIGEGRPALAVMTLYQIRWRPARVR